MLGILQDLNTWPSIAALAIGLAILAWLMRGPDSRGQACIKHEETVDQQDYPELRIPSGPQIELAMDPPNGLQHSNPDEPFAYENDLSSGSYLLFHAPIVDDRGLSTNASSADGMDYGEYFVGKTRLWELRLRVRFKQPAAPGEEFYFGIELEDYIPLGAGARHTVSLAVAAIRQAVGGVYQTVGDDPAHTSGEVERPCCVLPLWAFDQYIVTPPGETPPSLTQPDFPKLGSIRKGRVRDYAREVNALAANIDTGNVYSFASWGISRFLDVAHWALRGIPLVTPLGFDALVGQPPVYAVLYSLRGEGASDAGDGSSPQVKVDTRHLQSRKKYYFRAALWTSTHRPQKRRFEAMLGHGRHAGASMFHQAERPKTKDGIRHRLKRLVQDASACCFSRQLLG